MSSSPTPGLNLPSRDPEAIKQLQEQILGLIPGWVKAQSKSILVVCATAFRLIVYMFMHWMVGRFFGDFIAKDFPQVRRYVEDLSVGVFFFLIAKSLLELVWEELPKFKITRKSTVR